MKNHLSCMCMASMLLLCVVPDVYADMWELLTDVSSLKAGDRIVLACPDKGITAGSVNESEGYMEPVPSVFSSDASSVISLGEGTLVLTLGGTENWWTLTEPDGRILGAKGVDDVCYVSPDGYIPTWVITVSEDITTLVTTYGGYHFLYDVGKSQFKTYMTDNPAAPLDTLSIRLYRLVPQYTFMYEGYPGSSTRCEGGKLCKAGDVITISSVVPARENYTFSAWSYNNVVFFPRQQFSMPAADVILIPLWKRIPTKVESSIAEEQKIRKVVRNGSVYIMKDGKTYDVIGREQ